MNFLAFDPGVRRVGWARFVDDVLHGCGLWRPKDGRIVGIVTHSAAWVGASFMGYGKYDTIIEQPRTSNGRARRGDTNDLLDLSVVVGRLAEAGTLYGNVTIVTPSDWKGGREKEIDNVLTVERLSETERAILDTCHAPDGLLHNVKDAIGIGLWKLGRRPR